MPEYRADAEYKYRNSGSVSESATAMRTYLHCGDTAKPSALVYSGQSSKQNPRVLPVRSPRHPF